MLVWWIHKKEDNVKSLFFIFILFFYCFCKFIMLVSGQVIVEIINELVIAELLV